MVSIARLLIVNDEPNQLRTLGIALRAYGYEVDGAPTGDVALRRLAEHKYDLALLDLMLPGINGLDLARQLRQLFPTVKVVLISAYHLSERQLAQADCGAVGFVPKPYRVEDLAAFIQDKVS